MNLAELLLLAGNIVMFIGTALLIRTVIRNRHLLMGYDLVGSVLTMVGLLFFYAFYITASQWLSCVFATLTVSYWAAVVVFKLTHRQADKERPKVIPSKRGYWEPHVGRDGVTYYKLVRDDECT